ncbi:DHHA1 domain-containing protein [Halorubellus sp. PRR65]|uniref:DHH family phosphoesterase n=1 Tax=Halorubellus sp. PRR65 TaxID=3098148 RepID=UPI002B26433A|nr:DHHA1 domain-containing protein [Halorubellus sp. PRR65]
MALRVHAPPARVPLQLVGGEQRVVALAAAVVVALAALGALAWWWKRRQHPARRLRRALDGVDDLSILMHPNPDPDAMASAMAAATLARDAGATPVLQYPGSIRHQENRAFRTVLDLELDCIETRGDLRDDVVLVDHNEARGFQGADGVDPLAVVDHHPGDGTGRITDVRADVGACASLFVEYLQELDATVGADDGLSVSPQLATGLVYGIQSDTNHLTKGCSEHEFEASAYLYPAINEDLLDRIANPQVPIEVLETKAKAILEHDVDGSYAVCDLGGVPNVDAIPQAADELTHREGVTAVVVFGDYDGTVHVSGRSRDDRVHMGEALQAAVDGIPMAEAGGHARMGGGQLSLDHMNGLGPSDGVTREEFSERLFTAMAGDY